MALAKSHEQAILLFIVNNDRSVFVTCAVGKNAIFIYIHFKIYLFYMGKKSYIYGIQISCTKILNLKYFNLLT